MLRIFQNKDLTPDSRAKLMLRESAEDPEGFEIARGIVERVEREGLGAVRELTLKFDGCDLQDFAVSRAEFDAAEGQLTAAERDAFERAARNIRDFHTLQKDSLTNQETEIDGAALGFRYVPMDGAGVYVPGGKALYPSSVLMGVTPAVIAGVPEPLVITPPDENGQIHPAVLFCAKLAGTTRILKAGGAQAVAAAALGLVFPPVHFIAGPGNRFVTAAKQILASRGKIGLDSPAGPSEVIVIADESARADFVASDLLSQAEHGADSPAILLTDSRELAEATAREVERGIAERPDRADMKSTSIRDHSYAVVFDTLEDAFVFSNEYGPEHLEICTRDPRADLEKITSAGSIFLGHFAPVALGDYYSGTNHVLPTGGAARAYSGLGVDTFMKRLTYQHPTRESLRNALDPIMLMSKIEGLEHEHGHSVAVRFEDETTR